MWYFLLHPQSAWGQISGISLPLKISASSQDGGAGTGFALHQYKTEQSINHVRDIGQQATKDSDPWDMGNEVGDTYNPQAYRQKGISRHQCRGVGMGVQQSPWVEERQIWEDKWLELAEQSSREEKVAKREDSGDLWGIPPNLYLRTDQHMWEKMTHHWGKQLELVSAVLPL